MRHPTQPSTVLLCLLGGFALGGCAADPSPSVALPTVTDSADVRVVQTAGSGTQLAPWTVASRPDWRVGWSDDGPEFEGLGSGALRSDGGALVTDSRSDIVYVVGPGGDVEAVFGGRGDGPSEIGGGLRGAVLLPGDSVLTVGGDGRWAVFDATGSLGRTFRRESRAPYSLRPMVASPTGRIVMDVGAWSASPDPAFIPWRDGPVVATGWDGAAPMDTVGWFPMIATYAGPGGFAATRSTGERGEVDATEDRFVYAASPEAEVRWYGLDGELRQVARWAPERVAVDDEWWAAHKAAYLDRASGHREAAPAVLKRMEDALELERSVADFQPVFSSMTVGRDGTVWLGSYERGGAPPQFFTVLLPDGFVLGRVESPGGCRLLDVDGEYLLCSELDRNDVQAVSRYRIVKE